MYFKQLLLILLLANVALAISCRDRDKDKIDEGNGFFKIRRRLTVNASRNAFPTSFKTIGTALTTRATSARSTLMKPSTWWSR